MDDPVLKILRETSCKKCKSYAYNCQCWIINHINQPERLNPETCKNGCLLEEKG